MRPELEGKITRLATRCDVCVRLETVFPRLPAYRLESELEQPFAKLARVVKKRLKLGRCRVDASQLSRQ
jgi:hypothetical protein